jgi:protein-tyrosine phosphatase
MSFFLTVIFKTDTRPRASMVTSIIKCYLCDMRILMICLGNICRSPLAEGIMAYHAQNAGLNWEVDSAGTGGWHIGEQPHPLSQKVATMNGIDISKQESRVFLEEDMHHFDKIFVMDRTNYNSVKSMSGASWNPDKVDLLLNLTEPGANQEVPDPWSEDEEKYHAVFSMIDQACKSFVDRHIAKS